jgi:adenylylsulfate kinase-like enzyme
VVVTSEAGAVIWLTGLSGAGKTTIAQAVVSAVKPRCPELVLIDGDTVRAVFDADLDYTEPSRHKQITRIRRLAGVLAQQGQVVIVAALYSHPQLLAENRRMLPGYFEVYVKASMSTLGARDSKGLYAGAAAGEVANVVGVDIPWHEPVAADLILSNDGDRRPEELAAELIARVPRLAGDRS